MKDFTILETKGTGFAFATEEQICSYIQYRVEEGSWGKESDLVGADILVAGKEIKVYASWLTLQCIFMHLPHPDNQALVLRVFGLARVLSDLDSGDSSSIKAIDHCLVSPSSLISGTNKTCLPLPLAAIDISNALLNWKSLDKISAEIANDSVTIEMVFMTVIRTQLIKAFQCFLAYNTCKWLSANSVTRKTKEVKNSRIEREKKVQVRLANRLKGRIEVYTPSGIVDILTDTEVIEVKQCSLWKSAVGQVMAYQQHYPLMGKRIHLFDADKIKPVVKETIKTVCDGLDIVVSYE